MSMEKLIESMGRLVPGTHALPEGEEYVNESNGITVKKNTYSWGKMVTIHNGSKESFPLHPEHQEKIKSLGDGDSTTFKDETGKQIKATRDKDELHIGRVGSKPVKIGMHHFNESVNNGTVKHIISHSANESIKATNLDEMTTGGNKTEIEKAINSIRIHPMDIHRGLDGKIDKQKTTDKHVDRVNKTLDSMGHGRITHASMDDKGHINVRKVTDGRNPNKPVVQKHVEETHDKINQKTGVSTTKVESYEGISIVEALEKEKVAKPTEKKDDRTGKTDKDNSSEASAARSELGSLAVKKRDGKTVKKESVVFRIISNKSKIDEVISPASAHNVLTLAGAKVGDDFHSHKSNVINQVVSYGKRNGIKHNATSRASGKSLDRHVWDRIQSLASKHSSNESIEYINEIAVGKSYTIPVYNARDNTRRPTEVKVTNYVKNVDGSATVHFKHKDGSSKLDSKIFKSRIISESSMNADGTPFTKGQRVTVRFSTGVNAGKPYHIKGTITKVDPKKPHIGHFKPDTVHGSTYHGWINSSDTLKVSEEFIQP